MLKFQRRGGGESTSFEVGKLEIEDFKLGYKIPKSSWYFCSRLTPLPSKKKIIIKNLKKIRKIIWEGWKIKMALFAKLSSFIVLIAFKMILDQTQLHV